MYKLNRVGESTNKNRNPCTNQTLKDEIKPRDKLFFVESKVSHPGKQTRYKQFKNRNLNEQ